MPSESTSLSRTLNELSQAIFNSRQAYAYAAQHTRNRGLKLLLKSYAYEREQFLGQLQELGGRASAEIAPKEASGTLSRGLANVRAWFVVRRQARQRLLLKKTNDAEQAAMELYTRALNEPLNEPLPDPVQNVLRSQLAHIRQAQEHLAPLAVRRGQDAILVRLYENPDHVEQVVRGLEGAGVKREQIYIADIQRFRSEANEVAEQDRDERERSRWETMLAAAVLGALIGALIVLPFAIGLRIFLPQVNGIFAQSPNGVMLEYIAGGALVGLIFGLYFSIFIGQDIVEDDAYWTAQSLGNGKLLVAAPATISNRAEIERVLGLQHQFEVQPKPA